MLSKSRSLFNTLLILFLASWLYSCEESSSSDSPGTEVKSYFESGDVFTYSDSQGNMMELAVEEEKVHKWTSDFWSDELYSAMTLEIVKTTYNGGFPNREYYGIIQHDSGYVLGSLSHPFVNTGLDNNYYIRLFEFVDGNESYLRSYVDTACSNCCYKYSYRVDFDSDFYDIKYMASTGCGNSKKEMENNYSFIPDSGFTKFQLFVLKDE